MNKQLLYFLILFSVTSIYPVADFFTQDRPLTGNPPTPSQLYPPPLNSTRYGFIQKAKATRIAPGVKQSHVLKQRTPKTIVLNIVNNVNVPIIANIFVKNNPKIGDFGKEIAPQTERVIQLTERQWFEKRATGGLLTAEGKSQVRVVDVLMHGVPNVIELMIPNQKSEKFELESNKKYLITIMYDENNEIKVVTEGQS